MPDTRPIIAVGGENLIDHVTHDGMVVAKAGGSPFNVAMAMGKQGARVRYVSPISTDPWGGKLAHTLTSSDVELSGGRVALPTTMARVTIVDGLPSYTFERDATAERDVTQDSLCDAIGSAVALHTGSLTLTKGPDADIWEAVLGQAHDGGVFVSIDPNVRLSVINDEVEYRSRIMRIIAKVSLLKLSDEDLEALYPQAPEDEAIGLLLDASSASLVVLTRGAKDISAWWPGGTVTVPSEKVIELVDSMGAGDTFSATVLATLAAQDMLSADRLAKMKRTDVEALLKRASMAAGLNCTKEGCEPPNQAELEQAS